MLEVVKKQTSKSDDSNYLVSMFFSENSTFGNLNSFRNDGIGNGVKWISPPSKDIIETTILLFTDATFSSGFDSHFFNDFHSGISVARAKKCSNGYFLNIGTPHTTNNDWTSRSLYREDEYKGKIRKILSCVKSLELKNEREASKFLMKDIESSLKIRELTYLNELLSNLNSYELNPRSMVSALRSTYRAKSKLPIWDFALSFVEKEINAKGLNSRSWLIGLINEKN